MICPDCGTENRLRRKFRLLKEMFHATEREGRMRLVSVTWIGGIGESRFWPRRAPVFVGAAA